MGTWPGSLSRAALPQQHLHEPVGLVAPAHGVEPPGADPGFLGTTPSGTAEPKLGIMTRNRDSDS